MTSPFTVTTQLRCPSCGQIGIVAELQDEDSDLTGAHSAGFRQEGSQVVCRLCSHTFPVENPA